MLSLRSGGETCGVCVGIQQGRFPDGWGYWVVKLSCVNKLGGRLFVA